MRKERNLQIGDVVLVADDNLPRCNWPLGRIVKTLLEADGLVRTVEVKTANSVMSRPIHKLCVIESLRDD